MESVNCKRRGNINLRTLHEEPQSRAASAWDPDRRYVELILVEAVRSQIDDDAGEQSLGEREMLVSSEGGMENGGSFSVF